MRKDGSTIRLARHKRIRPARRVYRTSCAISEPGHGVSGLVSNPLLPFFKGDAYPPFARRRGGICCEACIYSLLATISSRRGIARVISPKSSRRLRHLLQDPRMILPLWSLAGRRSLDLFRRGNRSISLRTWSTTPSSTYRLCPPLFKVKSLDRLLHSWGNPTAAPPPDGHRALSPPPVPSGVRNIDHVVVRP